MSVKLYTDEQVSRAIAEALRYRGVDVLRAQEDNMRGMADSATLDRATELERALFSQDEDLLYEAALRQRQGRRFAGVIYAHPMRAPLGALINDLELLAKASEPQQIENQVIWLPL